MQLGKSIGVAALAAGSALVAVPSASAGSNSNFCPNSTFCSAQALDFPGGTISIDVDASSGPEELVSWTVPQAGNCNALFRVGDGPRSWVCNNLPAGNL